MSRENETVSLEEVDAGLAALPQGDVSPATRERIRVLAHAALARVGSDQPSGLGPRWLAPVAFAVGATTYLFWAVSAVQAILRP